MSLFFNVSKKGLIVRVLFCISAIVLIFMSFFYGDSSVLPKDNSNEATHNAVTTTQIIEETTRVFDPNLLNVSISSNIRIDNKSYSGMANIKNIQNENEYFIVDIKLNETGEKIYQSPRINNQEMVGLIEISSEIETGTHTATAYFNAYDKNTDEYITTVVLEIDITVVKTL